jgi:hypothetical protein
MTPQGTSLKQRVDEWCYSGALGKDNQKSEKQQEQEHRRQPPPFVLPKELQKFAGSVNFTQHVLYNCSHTNVLAM